MSIETQSLVAMCVNRACHKPGVALPRSPGTTKSLSGFRRFDSAPGEV